MSVEFRTNLPDFKQQLNTLRFDFQEKAVKAAARAAGAEFRKSAKGFAPVLKSPVKGRNTGELQKRIYSGIVRNKTAGTVTAIVSVRSGRKSQKGANDPFYWRFLEGGWIPRGPGKRLRGGTRTKRVARARSAHQMIKLPFLAPAFNTVRGAALDAFYRRLGEAIAKYRQIR